MPKVYESPSAQEHNLGVNGYGTEEYRMNQLMDIIDMLLSHNGIDRLRNKPEMQLSDIIADSNKYKHDLHLATHSDAGGGIGCTVFAWIEPGKMTNSQKAAECIYKYLSQVTPSTDHGVKDGRNLAEIRDTKSTAVLIETNFHDNPDGAKHIMEHMYDYAVAITHGICDYFEISFKIPVTSSETEIKDGQIKDLQKQVQGLVSQINEIKANTKAAQQYLKRINPDFIG